MDLVSPLMDAVAKGDQSALMLYLDLGADLMLPDERGYTVLHWCAHSDAGEKLVPFLINKGAQMDCADEDGFTPLMAHVRAGRYFGVNGENSVCVVSA